MPSKGYSEPSEALGKNPEALIIKGTPNREPQEYSRNIMVYKDPGRYIPIIYLLYSWGSQFGVPSRVPLYYGDLQRDPADMKEDLM